MRSGISLQSPFKYQKLLKACTGQSCLFRLHQVHASMIKNGAIADDFRTSKLLAAAATVNLEYTRSLFATHHQPTLFMFNTVLRAMSLACDLDLSKAKDFFESLRASGLPLDPFSCITIIKCCRKKLDVRLGMQVHGVALMLGFQNFVNLRNALLSLYCDCGMLDTAHQLFDEIPEARDAVSWDALMGGYLKVSRKSEVFRIFNKIRELGHEINPAAVVAALKTFDDEIDHIMHDSIQGYCIKSGVYSDPNVASCIITECGRAGLVEPARRVFDSIVEKDIVLWNCMVNAYAKNGQLEKSLALLQDMKLEEIKPNPSTFLGLLAACGSSANMVVGQQVHHYITRERVDVDTILGTALIDMYSKCGCIDKASEIFSQMRMKDVKSWTAIISGYGMHGQPKEALRLLSEMETEGERPNDITFLAVLSACNHGGLVVAGQECFRKMIQIYSIHPRTEHYGCVTDLLGRAGMLHEAYKLIRNLPVCRDPVAWRALLSACRVYGNLELSKRAKQALIDLGVDHPSDYILMVNTRNFVGCSVDATTEADKHCEELKKEAGRSTIQTGSCRLSSRELHT